MDKCELCERDEIFLTKHHLTPREEGGKDLDLAFICEDCHKQIHGFYTNKELAIRLNTIDDLKKDEKISKYIKFIKKQPSSKQVKIRKSNERRRHK